MARDESRFGPNSDTPDGDPYADVANSAGRVDIAAVIRDDALLDAIASDGPITTGDADEYQLASLLADWRAQINAAPIPDTLDFDRMADMVDREVTAVTAMRRHSSKRSGNVRYLRPVAAAAAAIAVAVGGLTAFSYQSSPGDPLWGIKTVVFSQQADSTEAKIDTASALSKVESLVQPGNVNPDNVEQAKQLLASAQASTAEVTDPAQRTQLEQWLAQLKLEISGLTVTFLPGLVPSTSAEVPVQAAQAPPVSGPPATAATVPPTPNPTVATTAPATTTPVPPESTPTSPTPVTPAPEPGSTTTTTASGAVGIDISPDILAPAS